MCVACQSETATYRRTKRRGVLGYFPYSGKEEQVGKLSRFLPPLFSRGEGLLVFISAAGYFWPGKKLCGFLFCASNAAPYCVLPSPQGSQHRRISARYFLQFFPVEPICPIFSKLAFRGPRQFSPYLSSTAA